MTNIPINFFAIYTHTHARALTAHKQSVRVSQPYGSQTVSAISDGVEQYQLNIENVFILANR